MARLLPREAPLHLPAQGSSHRLQKRGAAQAVTSAFAGVVHASATEPGVRLGTRQGEPIVDAAAQDFDALYAQGCSEAVQQPAPAKPMQVLPCEGKGGVMRPEAWREATRTQAAARAQRPPRGLARQEPSHRKRMATGVGLSHVDRHRRSPQTVARQFAPLRLVPSKGNPAPKPVGTKRGASLEKPRKTVMETGGAEGRRRAPEPQAEWVVLVDGDHTPIDGIEQAANASGVTVAIMVASRPGLAYLWKAANALVDPADSNAAQWVGEKIAQRRQGQGNSMGRSLRRSAPLPGLSAQQREPMEPCATSLAHHASSRNSPHSLAQGYPIATGVIEGACRSLVTERLERTGARWGLEGGEAVLTLRALSLHGAGDAYGDCHEKQAYQRHHQAKFSEMPTARPPRQIVSGGKS